MRIRYFQLTPGNELVRLTQALVEGVLYGERGWPGEDGERKILTAFVHDSYGPVAFYVLNIRIATGRLTAESERFLVHARFELTPSIPGLGEQERDYSKIYAELDKWPTANDDFYRQLAVAFDVPVSQVPRKFVYGGPLLMAFRHGITLGEAKSWKMQELEQELRKGFGVYEEPDE